MYVEERKKKVKIHGTSQTELQIKKEVNTKVFFDIFSLVGLLSFHQPHTHADTRRDILLTRLNWRGLAFKFFKITAIHKSLKQ